MSDVWPYTNDDSAHAASPSPASLSDMLKPDPAKIATAEKNIRSITEQEGKVLGASAGDLPQVKKDRAKLERAFDAESATVDEFKSLHWNADEEMRKYSHSPMEEFGSVASIFAIAASAFTHTPATNAMNAAAAYMNAVNSGDAAGYQKAFQAFKENSDLTIHRFNMEHEEFQNAAEIMDKDTHLGEGHLRAMFAKYQNRKALALMDAGMFPEIFQAYGSQAEAIAKWKESDVKLRASNDKLTYIDGGEEEFVKKYAAEHNGAKPKTWEIAKERMRLANEVDADTAKARTAGRPSFTRTSMSGMDADDVKELTQKYVDEGMDKTTAYAKARKEVRALSASPMTGNKLYDQGGKLYQFKYADDLIDKITSTIEQHIGAVGTAGYINRAGEAIGNILGSTDTDRKQVERWIDQLQTEILPLLLDQNRRPISAEAARVYGIVGGMRPGDTTANVIRNMQDLQEQIERRSADLAARLATAGGSGQAQPAAASTQNPVNVDDAYPLVK